jgi:hypothetical protein
LKELLAALGTAGDFLWSSGEPHQFSPADRRGADIDNAGGVLDIDQPRSEIVDGAGEPGDVLRVTRPGASALVGVVANHTGHLGTPQGTPARHGRLRGEAGEGQLYHGWVFHLISSVEVAAGCAVAAQLKKGQLHCGAQLPFLLVATWSTAQRGLRSWRAVRKPVNCAPFSPAA